VRGNFAPIGRGVRSVRRHRRLRPFSHLQYLSFAATVAPRATAFGFGDPHASQYKFSRDRDSKS